MPNAPKTPMHTVRVDDELWEAFGVAAAAAGADRSYVIRELIRWFVRQAGARLPKRPEPPV
jgi:predicted transcriptional regulator